MYLAYTPVGLPYIEGCQFRFLLHLVFPTIYLLSLKLNFLKINKNRLTLFSLFIECATFVFWTGANVFVSF